MRASGRDIRGTAVMNEQKARKLRRVEMAHDRFAGVLLAVGMPPKFKRTAAIPGEQNNYYNPGYRDRVAAFYVASFTSAPRPNVKTVKKFVRSYTRWLRRQHNDKAREYSEDIHSDQE